MNKVNIALMAIYSLSGHGLQYLAWLGESEYVIAAACRWSPCPGSPRSSTADGPDTVLLGRPTGRRFHCAVWR